MRIIQVDLTKDFSDAVREAVRVLKYGGTIVYPTDTLYGLGANALNDIAVRKIFAIKERPLSKPLPIIARNFLWAKELAHITPRNSGILEKLWPGQVTAVLPKLGKNIIPDAVNATGTIGMRIPDFKLTDELLGRFGYPLTATSANISGDIPTPKIDDIVASFSRKALKPDLIIDAGTLPPSSPSTIIDLTGNEPKILRVGAAKPQELMELLRL